MKKLQLTRDALAFGLSLAAPIMLAASLTGCTDSTAPTAIASSKGAIDPAVLARAVHFHLDLASGAMTVGGMAANRSATVTGGRANNSLLGSNEVTMYIFHFNHIVPTTGPDTIVMEMALKNNLQNSDLVASTSPSSPAQDSIVLAMVQVAANPSGTATPTGAWRGADASPANLTEWDMVTGNPCYTGQDCAVWTPVAPIAAGRVSAHFTIGFAIPNGSNGVDGYFLIGADVHDAPLPGTVAGTLSGIGIGPMSGVGVTLDGVATTTTAAGMFVFTGIKAGTHNVNFTGIPSYCGGSIPQTITVSAAQATQLTLLLPCYGKLSGTVTVRQGPLSGASVLVNGSVVVITDAQGHYTTPFVLGGAQTVTVTIVPGQTVTKDVSLDCSPLVGVVKGVLTEGGVPVANGTVTFLVDTTHFTTTTGADGSYYLTTVKVGAGLAFGADALQPWCSSVSGVPFTLASEYVPVVLNIDVACAAAPTFGAILIQAGVVGHPYAYQVPATGSGLKWQIASGGLTGVTLSQSGLISGTPTQMLMEFFTIRITDQFGRSVESKRLTLVVNPAKQP